MTSETNITEEFFRVFGIKTTEKSYCSKGYCYRQPSIKFSDNEICRNCEKGHFYIVPQITSDRLLQLICILNEIACEVLLAENIEDLKNEILETCIKVYNTPILTSDGDEYDNIAIYDKIQQLFKEEE